MFLDFQYQNINHVLSLSTTITMALLLLLLALSIFFLLLLKNRKPKQRLRLPPGPRRLPFIGNLHQLDSNAPQRRMFELSKQYGPLMSLRIGVRPALVVSSARMAKEVMKFHDLEFCSRPVLTGQQKLSYNGLDVAFVPYNDYWREMRKICVIHLFSSKRTQTFRPIREEEVSRFINKVTKFAEDSKPCNLSEAMVSLTISIICRISLGKKYEDDETERRKFTGMLTESAAMMGNFFYGDHFPFMGWLDKLNGMLTRLEKNFKELDDFYQEVIDQHLNPKRPKPEREDIVDVLLRIRDEKLFTIDLTCDHLKAVLMNVFLAGTETSAAAVIWAMSFLMKNPKAMKKAQEEVRNLVGNKGFVDEEAIRQLPYLKAVVKETFRLQPPAPLSIPRETTQNCTVDGYDILEKTMVYVNAWAIGRDPEAWDKPDEFYPERFLGSSIDFKGFDYELVPFGAGRRGCPGIHMGVATVDISLANLLYRFDWEMPPGVTREDIDFEVLPGITMHKKHHLRIVPKKYIN